jgi:predicted Rossmann fold nucleotide-binding protein DprA/Smf involved in DNA uptake
VSDPSHILEALGIEPRTSKTPTLTLAGSPEEKILYDLLAEPLPKDELIRASGLTPSDALTALVMLELKGVAKEEFGAWRRV